MAKKKKYNKNYKNGQLLLLIIKNQITYKNDNITLPVKSLTNMLTKNTFNGNMQTFMKELLHMNYKQNKILSNKLVVGLRPTTEPCGSSLKDV